MSMKVPWSEGSYPITFPDERKITLLFEIVRRLQAVMCKIVFLYVLVKKA